MALHALLNELDVHYELYNPVRLLLLPIDVSDLYRMLILLAFASAVSWIVRYRYLNMYARLPTEPQRQEPHIEVFPELQEGDSKRGLSNYLDEFLSAIKVFGYLERPVFHELTRTMQTRKLIAGETLLLEEEKGFCLVVDGLVQIFVKSNAGGDIGSDGDENSPLGEYDGHEANQSHTQRYQLLTEVKNGAPMSSLFSILSLFTEDIKLRHDEEDDRPVSHTDLRSAPQSQEKTFGSPTEEFSQYPPGSAPQSPVNIPPLRRGSSKREGESNLSSLGAAGNLPKVPPLSLDTSNQNLINDSFDNDVNKSRLPPRKLKSAHPDIVARATVDTTIAIIPATAFRRLTRVYPRATAHIVQVILTRLQRVTLATAHSYLGLTNEVLHTEKLMNRYTTYDLPGYLRDAPLRRLKDKFAKERERTGFEEGMKGIALHNPSVGRRRRSNSGLRREAATHAYQAGAKPSLHNGAPNQPIMTSIADSEERSGISAGDLLTNSHAPRHDRHGSFGFSQPYQSPQGYIRRELRTPLDSGSFNPFMTPIRGQIPLQRQESIDEDEIFRHAVLDCMFKAIGLTNDRNSMPKASSVEQSPRLVSFDSKRQKAVFSNAFGFIDPYEASADGDSESIISTPVSSLSTAANSNIIDDLTNDVEIVYFPQGSVLVEQGERNPGIYYVIDGFLDVSVPVEGDAVNEQNIMGTMPTSTSIPSSTLFERNSSRRPSIKDNRSGSTTRVGDTQKKRRGRRSLFLTKPGGLAGYLGTVSSYRSFIDVTAKTDVYVGFLPRIAMERVVDRYPSILLTMAKRVTTLLPRLILHIDFALEWIQVNAGQVLYSQDDESDAIYIVLNGRLRAIQEVHDDGMRVIGEFGQGDSVGELEVLTESRRPGSLHAIRDTEVAKLPKTLFNSLAHEHPDITIKISKIIASRMRSLIDDPLHEQSIQRVTKAAGRSNVSSTVNLRTVAILPVTAGVPVVEFSSRLLAALTQIGTVNGVVSLNQAAILNHLGRHAFNRMGKLKLSQYLADLEEKYGLVLYVADTNVKSPWTATCINQADCILLVGLATGSPNIGEYERFLLTTKSTARKELVILHSERFCPPGLTRQWLRNRSWINGSHHHIQMSHRTSAQPAHPPNRRFGSALKQRVQVIQAEIQKYTSRKVRQTPLYSEDTPFKGDFHRLARRLCGKSVGLVLGGGGARGIAQIGIIRALEESGIPIDIVGGTSIGAFIGALYAWDADLLPMYGRAKKFAGRMGSMWRFALDLTYPS